VPAYFNDTQRQATKDAATSRASKSCASSTSRRRGAAYGLDKKKDESRGVYDSEANVHISILDLGKASIEVKSTNGDTHLGEMTGTCA